MDEPGALLFAGDAFEIVHEFAVIGMARKGVDAGDPRAHFDGFAVDVDDLVASANFGTQGVVGAVTDEEHRRLGLRKIVFQMVHHATGFAHAAGGDDDERTMHLVDVLGIIGGAHHRQPLEAEGVLFLEQVVVHLLVVALRMEAENFRCTDGQRAIHHDGHIRNAVVAEKFVQDDENLLGPLDGEGWDDDLTLVFQRLAQNVGEVVPRPLALSFRSSTTCAEPRMCPASMKVALMPSPMGIGRS